MSAKGYISNFEDLQKIAPYTGFVNTTIDKDGVLRSTPLVYRFGLDVFGSLALRAAQLFLSESKPILIFTKTQDKIIPRSIILGKRKIPLDAWGRIIIPFRGPPYTFPYISAIDVIKGNVKESS
jgi:adenylate cyclase